jgi:hypothetical protein
MKNSRPAESQNPSTADSKATKPEPFDQGKHADQLAQEIADRLNRISRMDPADRPLTR